MLTESRKIKGKYTGWAAYANVGFDITERLNIELGVRYTEDEKTSHTGGRARQLSGALFHLRSLR
jgi:hypothetical protein